MIYFSSDYHFFHNREFIYKPRGFESIEEMNIEIIKRHNNIISSDDEVYLLGDLLLGGSDKLNEGLALIEQLNGKLHLIRGNHDTDKRWKEYANLYNVVELENAVYFNYKKYHFYLSHFPTLTSNLEKESLKQATLNLYGHTHQKKNFYMDMPFMYHVGVDSHNCYPISIDQIITEMESAVKECKDQL